MACLTVLFMNLHIPKYHIFYISLQLANIPTLKGQCILEGIVITLLPGINQSKDKITSSCQYPSMLPSQEERGPFDTTF